MRLEADIWLARSREFWTRVKERDADEEKRDKRGTVVFGFLCGGLIQTVILWSYHFANPGILAFALCAMAGVTISLCVKDRPWWFLCGIGLGIGTAFGISFALMPLYAIAVVVQ